MGFLESFNWSTGTELYASRDRYGYDIILSNYCRVFPIWNLDYFAVSVVTVHHPLDLILTCLHSNCT